MLRRLLSLALAAQAACLSMPSRTPTTGATSSASALSPMGRRQAVAAAFGAAAAFAVERASAYDAIPQVEPDFAAMEKLRAERLAKSVKKTAELNKKLAVLQDATKAGDAKKYIEAADDMALWVIGEGAGARASPCVGCNAPPMMGVHGHSPTHAP